MPPRKNPFDTVMWTPDQAERLARLRCTFWDVWHLMDVLLKDSEHKEKAQALLDDVFLQVIRALAREET